MKKTRLEVQTEEINFNFSKKKIYTQSFIFLPQNFQEKKLGSLYLLGQVNCKTKDYSYILNLFASLIKKEFFGEGQKIINLPPSQHTALCFKNALKKINVIINDLLAQSKNEWLKNLHFGGMVVNGDDIIFSAVGQIKIFLFRRGELMELTNSKRKVWGGHRDLKSFIFQNFTQGKVFPEDKIIFAAPNFLKIINQKGLQELVRNSLEFICDYFEKLLREKANKQNLSILFLRFWLKDSSLTDEEKKLFSLGEQKKYITPPIDLKEIFQS